jgi:hypothetical protein
MRVRLDVLKAGMRSHSLLAAILLLAAVVGPVGAMAGEAAGAAANLSFRLTPEQLLEYRWTIETHNVSEGREKGRAFKLTDDSIFEMTMALKGLLLKREGTPVGVHLRDTSYKNSKSIDQSRIDMEVTSRSMKVIQDGKTVVDSDNDIGLDRVNDLRERYKTLESNEVRLVLDPTGKPLDATGDANIVAALKSGGAQGLFPPLAGKAVEVGGTWKSTLEIPQLGEFRLAKPVEIVSQMTFTGWEEKAGVKLARILIESSWENATVHGESNKGMLAEITRTGEAKSGGGSCLFDPASGHFVEGGVTMNIQYHIEGEQNKEAVGLDVTTRSSYTFKKK